MNDNLTPSITPVGYAVLANSEAFEFDADQEDYAQEFADEFADGFVYPVVNVTTFPRKNFDPNFDGSGLTVETFDPDVQTFDEFMDAD